MNKKLNLDNVTLICVEGRYNDKSIKNSLKALMYSSLEINFKEILFLSPKIESEEILLQIKNLNINHYEIQSLDWIGYGNFILKNLYDYVKTDYCLVIQWDGFILNPHLWSNEFLKYDYIGAKWDYNHLKGCQWLFPEVKQKKELNLVGNGGFSLRSKKLLYETKYAPFKCHGPEDAYICNNYYDYFKSKKIKYSPPEIADRFSREMNHSLSWDSVFGFHGEKEFINQI
jgi:hypothetical protein